MNDNRIRVVDQMGNEVNVPANPERIISLVPSQTELLFDLGLEESLVGVTKFCIHPDPQVKSKVRIGGTKNFNFGRFEQLSPDLVIGNKEENYREGIEKLKARYPVWMSDISNLEDNRTMIRALGQMGNRLSQALSITVNIDKLINAFQPVTNKSVLYFIWRKPYMVAAGGTFINEILKLCGFNNVLDDQARYPELNTEQIRTYNPEVILLSSEPYPFKTQHMEEFKSLCPNARILLVDGEMFSWYGSRLIKAIPYFQALKALLD